VIRALVAGSALVVLGWTSSAFADEPQHSTATTPAPIGTPAAAEDLPLRFRDMLEFEAERARPERIFNGVITSVSSLGVIGAGAISLAAVDQNDPNRGVVASYGYIMISLGGTGLIASLIGMIPQSSAEQLYFEYAPIATDTRYNAALRIQLGEDALRARARKDAFMRKVVGLTNIAAGLGVASISVWRATFSSLTPADRAISATLTGASALLALGQGIARLWFMRGSAEIALMHWQASQGRMRAVDDPPPKTSLELAPFLAPIAGGFVGGVSARF